MDQVQSLEPQNMQAQPYAVRLLATIISYIFHPLFMTAYVTAFLLYIHPYAFAGFDPKMKLMRLLSVMVSTLLLPAFSVFLLRQLDFIRSIYLRTARERILPYAISLVFYFWIWYVFKNLSDSPLAIKQFLLGVFLGVCAAWMANIFFKISMHSTAAGGAAMFFLLQAFRDSDVGGGYLSIAILIAGLVCTARLILGGHNKMEIYTGLFAGAAAQVAAVYFS
jgi:hypothetical protein